MELLEKIGSYCLNTPWLYAFLVLLSAPVADHFGKDHLFL